MKFEQNFSMGTNANFESYEKPTFLLSKTRLPRLLTVGLLVVTIENDANAENLVNLTIYDLYA